VSDAREASARTRTLSTRRAGGEANKESTVSDREHRRLLREAVTELIADRIGTAKEEGPFSPTLWRALDEAGFTTVCVPEHAGGSGGTVDDLAVVLRACGYHAAPVPLAESNIAALLLATAAGATAAGDDAAAAPAGRSSGPVASAEPGAALPAGPLTLVADLSEHPVEITRSGSGWRAGGVLHKVPWAGVARQALVLGRAGDIHVCGLVPLERADIGPPNPNLAGEPAADVALPAGGVALRAAGSGRACSATARRLLTLSQALLIVGSLHRVLAVTIRYAREREQFGRPIAAFQAIGHRLATLAGAVEMADAVSRTAVAAVAVDGESGSADAESGSADAEAVPEALLAAKVCAADAARIAIREAHQVHGAIGVTAEYELHRHTRRLMAWRDQHGSERRAAAELGRRVVDGGAGALWELLTGTRGAGTRGAGTRAGGAGGADGPASATPRDTRDTAGDPPV
jgi:acyl-CoA dehydrogenase